VDGDYLKGLEWNGADRFLIEASMIRSGGYVTVQGIRYGQGLVYHYKKAITALLPYFDWNKWSSLLIENFVLKDEVGVMGPASSGKTYCAAAFAYCVFQVWPKGTSVVMSSTTREGLQLRVWGAIKEIHTKAKTRRKWLSGRIIESRYMLTGADSNDEAQDFRSGLIGVACKVGGEFVGLSNYVGLKNDRIILVADEASLMSRAFFDSISNLRKNPSFKLIALGNPKDRTDALGLVCEPNIKIGGWDGQDYAETTRTWQTRALNGIAIQLCGTDSPNYDYPRGLNPHIGLITPEQIENDLAYYGRDSMQFSMMNLGVMPKDGGSRRVVTMAMCERNQAFELPTWAGSPLTRVLGLDAAYRGVGGDRCVLIDMSFGLDVTGKIVLAQNGPQLIVPITAKDPREAEDQIVRWVMDYAIKNGVLPENVGFDSTGRGTLMGAFGRLWSPEVVPIEFGGVPTNRKVRADSTKTEAEEYGKMVTALWYSSRLVVESGQLRGISRECALEGASREWGINKNGKVDVEPKDKTKLRMGRSPDLWDSLVTGIEIARRRGFEIASGAGVGVSKRAIPAWLLSRQKQTRQFEKRHDLTSV